MYHFSSIIDTKYWSVLVIDKSYRNKAGPRFMHFLEISICSYFLFCVSSVNSHRNLSSVHVKGGQDAEQMISVM